MAPAVIQNQYLDGNAYMDCSQDTSNKVDQEVRRILEESYQSVVTLLTENRALLDEIALYLLEKETITGEELMAFVNADKAPAETQEPTETEESAEEPQAEENN